MEMKANLVEGLCDWQDAIPDQCEMFQEQGTLLTEANATNQSKVFREPRVLNIVVLVLLDPQHMLQDDSKTVPHVTFASFSS